MYDRASIRFKWHSGPSPEYKFSYSMALFQIDGLTIYAMHLFRCVSSIVPEGRSAFTLKFLGVLL